MFQSDYFNELINKLLNSLKIELSKELYDEVYKNLIKIYPNFKLEKHDEKINLIEFIEISANINEQCQSRKDLGKYYTPKDLCNFMLSTILPNKSCEDKKIIDPTCGNSEFLIEYIDFNLKKKKQIDNIFLETLSSNLYGNDNNIIATLISKVRIFFKLLSNINNLQKANLNNISENLNKNFTNFDAITELDKVNMTFDYIIGNPPYIENKGRYHTIKKHGNLYANVLENSLSLLNNKGKLCFIIPISYVSTQRMSEIRKIVQENTKVSKVFNFADRPSCLFTSVHQKLTIIACEKKAKLKEHKTFSSSYNFWYKKERESMFKNLSLVEVDKFDSFIPKIGNSIEKNIFKKVFTKNRENSISSYLNSGLLENSATIYLNMRATFWIKCFTDFSRSKEYKQFNCLPEYQNYLYCILNSSLFFWFWCVISDGWHITTKELDSFLFLNCKNKCKWNNLAQNLIKDLEEKKKFVNTKQIDFIYQHKKSKSLIDQIDNELAKIYKLTNNELKYIKEFAYKYRMSLGE